MRKPFDISPERENQRREYYQKNKAEKPGKEKKPSKPDYAEYAKQKNRRYDA